MKKVAILFSIILLLLSTIVFAQKSNVKPNIVFILADDLGYADVGCYGQQKIETPYIDKLAKQGLKFNQFYSGSTVCAPARSSFITGLHTGHTPIRGNKRMPPEGQVPLPDSSVTFSSLLQRQGYTTGALGKWSLGFITTSGDPGKKGFNYFYGYNDQTLAHNYYPDHLWENYNRIDFPENKTANTTYSADVIHQKALQFISDQQKPFFLYLPYTLPHADVVVPRDSVYNYYVKKFGEAPLQSKLSTNDSEDHPFEPYPHATYAAMVARLDRFIGEIMDALDKKGIAENTLVIFTSDNGPHKEHGGDPEFFNSNGIYSGIKRDLYEGGIRVPFIASWKGKIKPGTTEKVAALWDMFPTFLELGGVTTSPKTDGISIVPVLLNKGKQKQHDYLYWEFHESGGKQGVRLGDYKGIKLNVSTANPSAFELYDLRKDPAEKNNIAPQNPKIVKQIEAIISKAHVYNHDWPFLYKELQKED